MTHYKPTIRIVDQTPGDPPMIRIYSGPAMLAEIHLSPTLTASLIEDLARIVRHQVKP